MSLRDLAGAWINANPSISKAAGLALLTKNALQRKWPSLSYIRYPAAVALFLYFWITEAIARRPATGQFMDAQVLGFSMRLDPSEFLDCAMLRVPEYLDAPEISFLQQQLRPGDVFLDVGANIGLYSLFASRAIGKAGIVLAIEADPRTYERLCFHLRANGADNVRALNLAVSDSTGMQPFGIASHPWRAASGLLVRSDHAVRVPCQPLLDVLQNNGIERVRGAKFDIEGYEYKVLLRFLMDAKLSLLPDFLIIEFHPGSVSKAGGNSIELLKVHGYKIVEQNVVNYILARGD